MKKFLSKSMMILVLTIMCFNALSLTACSKGDDEPMIKSVTFYKGSSKFTVKPLYIYKIISVRMYNNSTFLEDLTPKFKSSSSKEEHYMSHDNTQYDSYAYCPFDNSDLKLNSTQYGLVGYYSYKYDKYVRIELTLSFQERIDVKISNKDNLSTIKYPGAALTGQPLKSVDYSMLSITIPTNNIVEIKY